MPPTGTKMHCFKCGDSEHATSQCTFEHRLCFNCRQPGHESRACPKPRNVLNRTCGGCGQKGHISSDCTDRENWMCKNCAGSGHGHWECSKPKGYRRKRCKRCNKQGHTANQCGKTSAWPKSKCGLCGEEGHTRWQCFHRPCFNCGEIGHEAILCFKDYDPSKSKQESGGTGAERSENAKAGAECRSAEVDTRPHVVPGFPDPTKPPPPSADVPHVPSVHCDRCGSRQHDTQSCTIFQENTNTTSVHSGNKYSKGTGRPTAGTPAENSSQQRPSLEDQARRTRAQRLYQRVNEILCEDDHDLVSSLLTQAIELDPSEPNYYITRATAHLSCRRYTAALQDFDAASTKARYIATAEVLLQVARCRLLLGSLSSALMAVREALTLSPPNPEALLMRRRVLDLQSNVEAYTSAVSRNHWRMARSAYESCLSVYAQVDSDAPTHIRCWGVEMLVVEASWEEAGKAVDVLLREAPEAVEAMVLRSLVLFLQAKLSDALSQVMVALKLDPDNRKAKDLRTRVKEVTRLKDAGNNFFRGAKWEEAIESWSEALQLVGERYDEGYGGLIRATLLLSRATARYKMQKYAEGMKDVGESLKLRPGYFKALLCRARIMVGLELYETAAEDFRAALEHGKSLLNASDVGIIEAELEDAEDAEKREREKEQDHYIVLGLSMGCTAIEIKKAYRMLCLKHHPDKGGVAEKFKKIAQAYEVLADPDKKRVYDAKHAGGSGYRSGSFWPPSYSDYDDY